jgi:uncharacterized protein YebE (UPF0316 family)
MEVVHQSFDIYAWVIVPLVIFMARLLDVSLGTLRFIFLSRGYKKIVPVLGFAEILIWIIAIREVMVNLKNWVSLVAYAGGFAMGNYIGMMIEEKLSIGLVMLRVVFRKDPSDFLSFMQNNDYGYTAVEGSGVRDRVKIIFSILNRKELNTVLPILQAYNPNAFYSVENVKTVNEGIFPQTAGSVFNQLFRKFRKSK